ITAPVEYSWWIDEQPHSMWTQSSDVTVDSQYLFLQGKHVLHASARIVGHPESEGSTPASAPFLIDVIAPSVALVEGDHGLTVNAYDYVSDVSALRARFRVSGSGSGPAWSDWQPLSSLQTLASGESVDVQVIDEAGNVGEANGLIRGQQDPTLASA